MSERPLSELALYTARPTVRVNTNASSVRLAPSQLVPKIASATVATDAGATFKVGGKASFEGAAGLRADVGATGKLTFDAS